MYYDTTSGKIMERPPAPDPPRRSEPSVKPNVPFEGWILFCWACDGSNVIIDMDWAAGADTNPEELWLDVTDFIGEGPFWTDPIKQGKVYKFTGTYRQDETGCADFEGVVKPIKT